MARKCFQYIKNFRHRLTRINTDYVLVFKTLLLVVIFGIAAIIGGCVERQLTIKTVPSGGVVVLNDEEIGEAPVTVGFEWYGDYNVRISKAGYETLKTHRELQRPWYDVFPFDFFTNVVWLGKINDKYEWTFDLKPYVEPTREQLIEDAQKLKKEAASE